MLKQISFHYIFFSGEFKEMAGGAIAADLRGFATIVEKRDALVRLS